MNGTDVKPASLPELEAAARHELQGILENQQNLLKTLTLTNGLLTHPQYADIRERLDRVCAEFTHLQADLGKSRIR